MKMIPNELREIANKIAQVGGKVFLVGGSVRDSILGLEPKDFDCECFGIDKDTLIETLKSFGKVDCVGSSFGVIKLTTDQNDFDFSIPRRENKIGKGHKGFQVEFDETITPKEAASRRDFTFNALMQDIETGQVLDFFGGIQDLTNKTIKATSKHFKEDPLRVLRGFQFVARFCLSLADFETLLMCNSLKSEFDTLAKERIWIEFEKWASKGTKPSFGIDFLIKTDWVSLFPELAQLIGLEQSSKWHPEGDVMEHTRLVVDECAKIANRENLNKEQRIILILAGLCHDFGKIITTEFVNGKITSKGHDKAGTPFVKSFLNSIDAPKWVIEQVVPLCENHMFRAQPTHRNIRRLANRISPSNIQMLVWLMEADSAHKPHPTDESKKVLEIAQELNCESQKVEDILMGRHLIELGLKPGVEFGVILNEAREAQLDGEFSDLVSGMEWLRERVKKF